MLAFIKNVIIRILAFYASIKGFILLKRKSTLVVGSQRTSHEIFSKDIMKRPHALGLGNFFGRWLGCCLGCLDSRDPKWGQTKKIFIPLFDSKPDPDMIMVRWRGNLLNLYNKSKSDYQPISIHEIINNVPLYFVLNIVFGETFVDVFKAEIDALKILSDELMCISFNNKWARYQFYEYLSTAANKKLSEFMIRWEKLLRCAKNERYLSDGIYQKLLENYYDSGLEWKYFSQTMIEVTFANQDVTIASMAWLLVHYSLHPCHEADPQNFIEESARITPIIKYSMPKTTTKDFIIDGHFYGSGTTVIVDFDALGHSADWGTADLDFNPARFDAIEKKDFVGRFGYGGRHCPGNKLTNLLFNYIIQYLRRYWVLIPTSPVITIKDIKIDPAKPFRNPIHKVYLLPKSLYSPKSIYYECHPCAEINENVFMAISVNTRSPFLTDDNLLFGIIKYLSERNASKKVLILICDAIAKYNLQAFDHYNASNSSTEAAAIGDKFIGIFKNAVNKCGADNVIICRWNDINHSDLSFLEDDKKLIDRVASIAERFVQYRGQGVVNTSYQSKIELVKKYILSEIGVLINGVCYNGIHYRVLYYSGTPEHLKKFAGDPKSLHNLVLSIYNDSDFKNTLDRIVGCSAVKTPKCQGFIGIEA